MANTLRPLTSIQEYYKGWINGGDPPKEPCPAMVFGNMFEYAYKAHTGDYYTVEGVFLRFELDDHPHPKMGRTVWMWYRTMSRSGEVYDTCTDVCPDEEGAIWPAMLEWY